VLVVVCVTRISRTRSAHGTPHRTFSEGRSQAAQSGTTVCCWSATKGSAICAR